MFAASPSARMTALTLSFARKQVASSSKLLDSMLISPVIGNRQRRSLIVPRRRRGPPALFASTRGAPIIGASFGPQARINLAKWESMDRKPTMEIAHAMARSLQELDNSSLVTLARLGDHEANGEILTRHIMTIDKCSHDDASDKVMEIDTKLLEYAWLEGLPYKIGITAALAGGLGSFPLVFDLNTALWFNVGWVTTDVPEPHDLETALEVGSWTWNWMEPVLGQISFFLLCLQYARAQLHNLGIKPYTRYIKNWRGQRLAGQYPNYDARFLIDFAESATLIKK